MFATLSLLALSAASANPTVDVKAVAHKSHKAAVRQMKKGISNAVKHIDASRKLADASNSTDAHRELRYRPQTRHSGFVHAVRHGSSDCMDMSMSAVAVPLKKMGGCESTPEGGSAMSRACHIDGSGTIQVDFDVYSGHGCQGEPVGTHMEPFELNGMTISGDSCVNMDHGEYFKFSCVEEFNPFYAQSGMMEKEFEKSWECEENVDPMFFHLMSNGACWSRDMLSPEDTMQWGPMMNSVAASCAGDMNRYEGFGSYDCTGAPVFSHEEPMKKGCRGYHSEKCIAPGYLVRSQSLNGVQNLVSAQELEKCYKLNVGTQKITMFKKDHSDGFHYKLQTWNETNIAAGMMCEGMPDYSEDRWVPNMENDMEMLGADMYVNKYWHAHTLKEALNLNLFKEAGNDMWNDWFSWDTYANDMCEGEPHTIYAGKQMCTAGYTNICSNDMMVHQKHTTADCEAPAGAPFTFHRDVCENRGMGMWQKGHCEFRGQEYHGPFARNQKDGKH